ncbi:MAG: hypothetical protein EOP84_04555 [Verrucomicrobiaceae bacterium]|nr:MAG: hypothetical protein EOP84_04555 [Verrucomicrobiaceae bacterium]
MADTRPYGLYYSLSDKNGTVWPCIANLPVTTVCKQRDLKNRRDSPNSAVSDLRIRERKIS